MADTFKKGDRFGGFIVQAKIHTGEFGETWLCENPITRRKGVLKGLKEKIFKSPGTFLQDFDIVNRTKEEAQIVAALDDRLFQFVPKFYDAVEVSDGRVFFLTEFIEGHMLRDLIQESKKSQQDRASIAVNLIYSINRLHGVGIVHRDLAGDNIIISDKNQVKILDFGLAKIKSELLVRKYSEKTVVPFSKAKYTPPKVILARKKKESVEADETWDLYALGVLFFEIFSGRSVSVPESEISQQALAETPCPDTIRKLFDNGITDNAPAGDQIAITFNRELRKAGLEAGLMTDQVEANIVQSLRQEIEQLQKDLQTKRGKTGLQDIANYLSRLGLAYTVIPKKNIITVEYPTKKMGTNTFVVDAGDERVLKIDAMKVRTIKTKRQKLLSTINTINWNAEISKLSYDPNDGEVRLCLRIPHLYGAIPYEEFAGQFAFVLAATEKVCEELDKDFPSPERAALGRSKNSTDGESG